MPFSPEVFLERLAQKLVERGLSERAACLRAGLSETFIKSIRRQGSDPGVEKLTRIAKVLQVRLAWLIGEDDIDETPEANAPAAEAVRLVGEVRASNFRTAFEIPKGDQSVLWLPPEPRYPGVPRGALKVSGPSVNQIAPDGATIIFARFLDLEQFGRRPRHGDIVVVQRWHHDLVEATCKAFVEKPDGIWLEPRTTAADIAPIHLLNAKGEPFEQADEIVIHALVLTVMRDL